MIVYFANIFILHKEEDDFSQIFFLKENGMIKLFCVTYLFSFYNFQKVTAYSYQFFVLFSGELMFLNEATFLDNLKTRYYKDKIYVRLSKLIII